MSEAPKAHVDDEALAEDLISGQSEGAILTTHNLTRIQLARQIGNPEFRKRRVELLRTQKTIINARILKLGEQAIVRLQQDILLDPSPTVLVNGKTRKNPFYLPLLKIRQKAAVAVLNAQSAILGSDPDMQPTGAQHSPMFVLPAGSRVAVSINEPQAVIDIEAATALPPGGDDEELRPEVLSRVEATDL